MILLRGVDPVSHFFWRHYEPDAAAYAPAEPDVRPATSASASSRAPSRRGGAARGARRRPG
jgi:hypothetical protein